MIRAVIFLCLLASMVEAQEVVINTGMVDKVYSVGMTEGDPVIIPAMVNHMKITLDRANLGAATAQTLITMRCQEFDGLSWNNCGAIGTIGGCIPNPFTPENDCRSASVLTTSFAPSIEPRTRRIVYEIGGSNPVAVQTNSAVQTWEVK